MAGSEGWQQVAVEGQVGGLVEEQADAKAEDDAQPRQQRRGETLCPILVQPLPSFGLLTRRVTSTPQPDVTNWACMVSSSAPPACFSGGGTSPASICPDVMLAREPRIG